MKSVKLRTFSLLLSLLFIGTVGAGVQVESRSHPPVWEEEELGAAPAASFDLLKKIEFLQQEMQELRGKVEEQTYQLQQLQSQQKKLYLDLEKRLQEKGPAPKAAAASSSTGGGVLSFDDLGTSTSVTVADPGLGGVQEKEEEKAYQVAYRLIQSKDYEGALVAFKTHLTQFPQGKYLPNAHYWLGEIYLSRGELPLAAQAFEIVYRQYPHHPKAADSLLKLGYVEYAKGEWKQAQQYLTQVKIQFADTTSAQLADAKLAQMQREGHL